jgi:hypothetical protein
VILADADQPVAPGIHHIIGVAQIYGRGERFRDAAGHQPVQALVGEVGKVQHAIVDQVAPAPIFMHAGARVPRWGQQVAGLPIGRAPDDDDAPLFFRAHFFPVDHFPLHRNPA